MSVTLPRPARVAPLIGAALVAAVGVVPMSAHAAPGDFTVTPSIAFGGVYVAQQAPVRSVIVTNVSGVDQAVSVTAVSGPPASSDACNGATLGPNDACQLTYTVTPTQVGPASGAIQISIDGETFTIPYTVNGLNPVTLSPSSVDLGVNFIGESSQRFDVLMTNNSGDQPNVQRRAERRRGCSDPVTIGPGASCMSGTAISSVAPGSSSSTTTYTIDYGSFQATQSLTYTATWLHSFEPVFSDLDFGDVEVGESATSSFVITNISNEPKSVAPAVFGPLPAGFELVGDSCAGEVANGAQCAVEVRFTPTATGAAGGAATMTFRYDRGGDPAQDRTVDFAVTLSGNGVDIATPPTTPEDPTDTTDPTPPGDTDPPGDTEPPEDTDPATPRRRSRRRSPPHDRDGRSGGVAGEAEAARTPSGRGRGRSCGSVRRAWPGGVARQLPREHLLVDHELAVVLADRAGGRAEARVGEYGLAVHCHTAPYQLGRRVQADVGRRRRRRALPLGLGRQAGAGPAGEGVGLVPAHVHDGLVGVERPRPAERERAATRRRRATSTAARPSPSACTVAQPSDIHSSGRRSRRRR